MSDTAREVTPVEFGDRNSSLTRDFSPRPVKVEGETEAPKASFVQVSAEPLLSQGQMELPFEPSLESTVPAARAGNPSQDSLQNPNPGWKEPPVPESSPNPASQTSSSPTKGGLPLKPSTKQK